MKSNLTLQLENYSLKMSLVNLNEALRDANDTAKPHAERRLSLGTASTCTDSSASSSSKPRVSVVVSFCCEPTVHTYERDYLLEDKAVHWYDKAEIQAMVDAEKKSVHDYTKQDKGRSYVTALLKVWSTPCMQPEVLSKLVKPIQASPMRGLEKHALKSIKQRRSVVMKKVLQAQIDLCHYEPDPQERAILLKEECQPLSRTSARFARAMALGDAQEASACYKF